MNILEQQCEQVIHRDTAPIRVIVYIWVLVNLDSREDKDTRFTREVFVKSLDELEQYFQKVHDLIGIRRAVFQIKREEYAWTPEQGAMGRNDWRQGEAAYELIARQVQTAVETGNAGVGKWQKNVDMIARTS